MGKIVGYIPKAPVEVPEPIAKAPVEGVKGDNKPDTVVEPVEGAKPTSKAKVKKE